MVFTYSGLETNCCSGKWEPNREGFFTNTGVVFGGGGNVVNRADLPVCLSLSLISQPTLCGFCGTGPSSLQAAGYL